MSYWNFGWFCSVVVYWQYKWTGTLVQYSIHQLQEFGYEIEYDPHKKGYYLKDESREFTLQELRLLIDSVQSSRFITQRKAKKLTQKLKAKASIHKQKSLDNRHSYVANRVRNMNESAFTHISDIHRAIANDYKISFRYFGYTWEKKPRYFRNGEPYVVSPFALLWSDTNYYLYAYDNGTFKHFRVDRMDSIRLVLGNTNARGNTFRALLTCLLTQCRS